MLFFNSQNANLIALSRRVISAAPVLLKPANIRGLKTFQDERWTYNNPVDLALWEYQKIWPSTTIPDIVLSLGTGTKKDSDLLAVLYFEYILKNGFISGLCRLFMSFFDGKHI